MYTNEKMRIEILTKMSEEILSACESDQATDTLDRGLLSDTNEILISRITDEII